MLPSPEKGGGGGGRKGMKGKGFELEDHVKGERKRGR